MQIILLEKVANLGNLGDVVKVKDGYARNFLIPTAPARRATEAAIKEFEAKRAELEKAAADKLAAAQALGEKLSGKTVHITQKAGVDGRLFGSVTNADIAEALTQAWASRSQKAQVRLPNGPLKTVGEHPVSVAPHTDVVVDVTVHGGRRDRLTALAVADAEGPARAGLFHLRRAVPRFHRFATGCPQACPQARARMPRLASIVATMSAVFRPPLIQPPPRATTRSPACACRRIRSRPSRACSAACCSTTAPGTAPATC